MIDPLFFDTDCLSAFLWSKDERLLAQLYPGRVVIPRAVYAELSRPGIAHLKARLDTMLAAGQAVIAEIGVGTDEYDVFYKLTQVPDAGHRVIGDGEAAAMQAASVSSLRGRSAPRGRAGELSPYSATSPGHGRPSGQGAHCAR